MFRQLVFVQEIFIIDLR